MTYVPDDGFDDGSGVDDAAGLVTTPNVNGPTTPFSGPYPPAPPDFTIGTTLYLPTAPQFLPGPTAGSVDPDLNAAAMVNYPIPSTDATATLAPSPPQFTPDDYGTLFAGVPAAIQLGIAAMHQRFAPVTAAGDPLSGPLLLYTGQAAETKIANLLIQNPAAGYTLKDTAYYLPELEGVILPEFDYMDLWGYGASQSAVIDAFLGGNYVDTANTGALAADIRAGSIQATIEQRLVAALGAAVGAAYILSGISQLVSATSPDVPDTLGMAESAGGATEIVGGVAFISGAVTTNAALTATGAAIATVGNLPAWAVLAWQVIGAAADFLVDAANTLQAGYDADTELSELSSF